MSTKSPGKKKPAAIRPARARYIKLGTGGEWEAECIEKGIIRFGFDSLAAKAPAQNSGLKRFPHCSSSIARQRAIATHGSGEQMFGAE